MILNFHEKVKVLFNEWKKSREIGKQKKNFSQAMPCLVFIEKVNGNLWQKKVLFCEICI